MGKRNLRTGGVENTDSTPLRIPLGFKRPETLAEQVQRLVRGHLSRVAEEQGFETFEEAEDFDVEDDMDFPETPYELVFDPVLEREISADEFRRNADAYREEYARVTDREMERSRSRAATNRRDTSDSPPPEVGG